MNGQTKFILDQLREGGVKSVLNIGFRYDSDKSFRDLTWSLGGTFSVLEAYGPNCEDMRKKQTADNIHEMDVRNIANLNETWDAIVWLHGPEHIYWNEFLEVRKEIEKKANKFVIYQAPIGVCPQDEIYGNPYERHVESLVPEQFADIGYEIVLHDGAGKHAYDFVPGEFTFSAIHRIEG
jgi:hypothetical protein